MFRLSILLLVLACFSQCSKTSSTAGKKVDIYLLKSFTRVMDTSNQLVFFHIEDPVLEEVPLVKNSEILFYEPSVSTFRLIKNIQPRMDTLTSAHGFAVTVNGDPIYYGLFHPIYMSSILFGVATINPSYIDNELKVNFVYPEGIQFFQTLDKRNDSKLLDAFRSSGRLR